MGEGGAQVGQGKKSAAHWRLEEEANKVCYWEQGADPSWKKAEKRDFLTPATDSHLSACSGHLSQATDSPIPSSWIIYFDSCFDEAARGVLLTVEEEEEEEEVEKEEEARRWREGSPCRICDRWDWQRGQVSQGRDGVRLRPHELGSDRGGDWRAECWGFVFALIYKHGVSFWQLVELF